MTTPNTVRNRPYARIGWLVCAVLIGSVLTVVALATAGALQFPTRQDAVAARGAAVMPFDLTQTTHIFQSTDDGALQQVVAIDSANSAQIGLIQAHLRDEAVKFARGDFSAPVAIHGADMPGVAVLQGRAAALTVAYTPLPTGGQIRYTTSDPAVRHALHQWIAAQLSDHGDHVTMGH